MLDPGAVEPILDVRELLDDVALDAGLLQHLARRRIALLFTGLHVPLGQRPDARRRPADHQPSIGAVGALEHETARGALVLDARRPAARFHDAAPSERSGDQRSPTPLFASLPTCASSTRRTGVCSGMRANSSGSSCAFSTSVRSVSTNASSVCLLSVSVGSIMRHSGTTCGQYIVGA